MKKSYIILLAFIFLFSQLSFVSADEYQDLWEKLKAESIPGLIIVNEEMPIIEAGATVTLPITIKNNTSYGARDIVITPILKDGDSNFLTFETLSPAQNIQRINANKTEILNLIIKIDPNSPEKTYQLDLNFKYANEFNRIITSSEATLSQTINFKIKNKNTSPRPQVFRIDTKEGLINPGEKISYGFAVKNNGTLPAKDIKVSLEGNGIDVDKFLVVDGPQTQHLSNLDGNKLTYFTYTLKASDKIKSGNHDIKIKFEYKDAQNQVLEETYQSILSVEDSGSKIANIFLDNIVYPSASVKVNEDFTISFDLHNLGSTKAHNVKVSLESDKEIIPKSTSIRKLNALNINQVESFSFVLTSTSEAVSKNYPIKINIEYEEEKNGEKIIQNTSQYVGVYIEKPDDNNNSVPKIIIDQYNFEPHIVKAGENFHLSLSFLNTNKSKSIQNIKIFLTVNEESEKSGNVFTPVNSSNTFYIDSISPKSRVEKDVLMYTVPDAKPKTYTITANFEYEDSDGKEYTATELIGIPVIQQSKLETTEINLPPEGFIGQPIPISLEFYNMGKVTLSNLMVKIAGNFHTESPNYFVGNFDAGNSEYYETMIIPQEPGMLEGSVIFAYEDSNGETIEVLKDFSINIIEMPVQDFPPDDFNGMDPGMQEGNLFTKLLKNKILWFVVITGLGAGTFVFLRRRASKKKAMALDE